MKAWMYLLYYHTIKQWIRKPIEYYVRNHTIVCPTCHESRYQLRRYKKGQETRCDDCILNEKVNEWCLKCHGRYDCDYMAKYILLSKDTNCPYYS